MFYNEVRNKFERFLKDSGVFDKVEIKVIMAMIDLEKEGKVKNTASEIAKKSGMSVTNAYKYLYNLAKFGIVEFEEDKQKVFWLSRVNPFPRIISIITNEYLNRKASLKAAEELYNEVVVPVKVNKLPEVRKFSGFEDFERYIAYMSDLAKKEINIVSDYVPKDSFIILDSWKRAKERDIRLRWVCSEMSEENIDFLKRIGFEVRFYDEISQPFILISDEKNGVILEDIESVEGVVFFNIEKDLKEKFELLWDKSGEIK